VHTVDNVLSRIVAHKRDEIEAAKQAQPIDRLENRLADAPDVRNFAAALTAGAGVALIAEVKKASPSAGVIREDYEPAAIASIYESHGASCLSVLTDEHFFQGHPDDLKLVVASVRIPVMRKEFIIDRYQIVEARLAGADCVLLIAECLNDDELAALHCEAHELGMETLIEIHDPANLERVLDVGPRLVGINNRDLQTFVTDLDHTLRLRERVPGDVLLVSESGIRCREDVLRLEAAGVNAILVGESLMRQPDIGVAVDELLGHHQGF